MTNIERVQQIYAAFGRGDVPTILGLLAEDVEWEYGVNSTDVPWLQPRRGRANVGGFFEALSALEFLRFEPTQLFANGDTVVALIELEAKVTATGRPIVETDEVHIWHFDSRGQVARFRHRADTHQHLTAWGS